MKNKFKKKSIVYLLFLFLPMFITAQNNLIPNTLDCSAERPPFAFDIQKAWTTSTGNKVYTCTTPLVGDIDGDGKTEVLALIDEGNLNSSIYVFEGTTGAHIGTISPLSVPGANSVYLANAGWTGTTFCLLDGNKDGKAEIFIAAQSGQIFLYEVTSYPGARPIQFTERWKKQGYNGRTSPVVADLDGDGVPEFVAGNKIFDYSGDLKATLAYKGNAINFAYVGLPLVVDLDKDGIPEIVVGTNVYKYNGTSATLWKTCPSVPNQDGCNMAADINQDGYVDLVFHTTFAANPAFVKVWTPYTGQDLGNLPLPMTGYGQRSIPFIGDIDGETINGKKYPEICINTDNPTNYSRGTLYAFSYNGSNFVEKWLMPHSDGSGGTILTLFDFNNDGVVELVYRDETHIHILDGSGSAPVSKFSQICGSETATESPIVADVLGTGSANILVTGNETGKSEHGEVVLFEGAASKWISCPSVWNQQLYSNLLVNLDLTIPQRVEPLNKTFTRPNYSKVQFYNGCPMQAPYISETTYFPIDLSSDVWVVDGSIEILSPTSVRMTVTFGNQGLVAASAHTPICYYHDAIAPGNSIGSETLGIALDPGETKTIQKTLTDIPANAVRFYVRVLDDGTNFPAHGAFSDCNLTNNTKSFGTLELLKTVNSTNACVDGTSVFHVKLTNNTHLTSQPQTFNNIVLVDSLSAGWVFISATSTNGIVGTYNASTRKTEWTLTSLAPGSSAELIMGARATTAGSIRNSAWIQSVEGNVLGREVIEAYVIVNSETAPVPATIIATSNPTVCGTLGTIGLIASTTGQPLSFQWYRNNVEIPGAVYPGYAAIEPGNYTVTYFNGTCVSQMSNTISVRNAPSLLYWSKNAQNSNWNDPANWNMSYGAPANAVPIECTTVHIPGHAAHFPDLDPSRTPQGLYGVPQCDKIIFHFGAEVAKPHNLIYNKAFVQYNFGYRQHHNNANNHEQRDVHSADIMERGRWYALAAPLKKIVTGDFSFGGFPLTWQQSFHSAREHTTQIKSTNWYAPSNNVALEIGAGQNYAICLYVPHFEDAKLGLKNHKNLNYLNGVLELPFFEDGNLTNHHPHHSHSGNTTTIKYFKWEEGFPVINNEFNVITRGNEAYRFVFENASNQPQDNFVVNIPVKDTDGDNQNDEVMIGNPFISSLDLTAFLSDNSTKIESQCRVYSNGAFATHTTGMIHPLQGFFVKPKGTVGTEVGLTFKKNHSIARTDAHNLRSSESDLKGAVKVTVSNDEGSSFVTLVFDEEQEQQPKNVEWLFYNASNPYNRDNAGNILPSLPDHPEVPQLYALDGKNNRNAIQHVASNGSVNDIPLGIKMRSSAVGTYLLSVEVPQDIAFESLMLLDRETNRKINMLSGGEYSFMANNFSDMESRFVLLAGKSATGINEMRTQSPEITIYAVGNTLYVESPQQGIRSINVSSMQGVRIATIQGEGKTSLSKELYLAPGVYVVTATTGNGEIAREKVIVN